MTSNSAAMIELPFSARYVPFALAIPLSVLVPVSARNDDIFGAFVPIWLSVGVSGFALLASQKIKTGHVHGTQSLPAPVVAYTETPFWEDTKKLQSTCFLGDVLCAILLFAFFLVQVIGGSHYAEGGWVGAMLFCEFLIHTAYALQALFHVAHIHISFRDEHCSQCNHDGSSSVSQYDRVSQHKQTPLYHEVTDAELPQYTDHVIPPQNAPGLGSGAGKPEDTENQSTH